MTVLSKGIIEIDGLEINPEITPEKIKKIWPNKILDNMFTKNKTAQGMFFNDVKILEKVFDINLFFYHNELKIIEMHCSEEDSDKEQFKADCKWLENMFGEPTTSKDNFVIYEFPFGQISVTNFNGRREKGHQEFISISYK